MDPLKYDMIAVTGGPAGGKSSGMACLRSELMIKGIKAVTVPEAATLLFTNGVDPRSLREDLGPTELQRVILCYQKMQEEVWQQALDLDRSPRKVVLCDRGMPDSEAYVGKQAFRALLHDEGLSMTEIRERRYKAVAHMVTAANGAEEFYNLDNPARTETLEEARALDLRTQSAWIGHDHLHIIGNRSHIGRQYSFDEKRTHLVRAVFSALGVPEPIELESKFWIIQSFDYHDITTLVSRTYIEQDYLVPGQSADTDQPVERRVRKMVPLYGEGPFDLQGEPLFVYTEKAAVPGKPDQRYERERVITAAEHLMLLRNQKSARHNTIRKIRHSFVYLDQYFQVDTFLEIQKKNMPLVMAEVEFTTEEQRASGVAWPNFLGAKIEVSDDQTYKNEYLARA